MTLTRIAWSSLFGCEHVWTWPRRLSKTDQPLLPFDSYQACTSCGAQRYYCSRTFQSGPSLRAVGPSKAAGQSWFYGVVDGLLAAWRGYGLRRRGNPR